MTAKIGMGLKIADSVNNTNKIDFYQQPAYALCRVKT